MGVQGTSSKLRLGLRLGLRLRPLYPMELAVLLTAYPIIDYQSPWVLTEAKAKATGPMVLPTHLYRLPMGRDRKRVRGTLEEGKRYAVLDSNQHKAPCKDADLTIGLTASYP
jgi:hypothetical protein